MRRDWGNLLLWLPVFFLVSGLTHLLMPTFFDSDTAYHLAVARIIREGGLPESFPWTPFSWLAEHYADKELFFHLFLLPVADLDPTTASRIAGTLLGTLLLTVIFFILQREGVRSAGIWALAVLSSSTAFYARFAMVRPHLIAIPLALLLLWSAVRRRQVLTASLSFVFPFFYTAWHLPVCLAVAVEVAGSLAGKTFRWRGPLLVLVSVCAGAAWHPDFPENFRLFWLQDYVVLFGTAWGGLQGYDMGGEFGPFSLGGLARYASIPLLLLAFSAASAWRCRRTDTLPLAVVLCAAGFLALTLRTQRFIEYLVPLAVMGAALTLRPHVRSVIPSLILVGGVAWAGLFGRHPLDLMRERTDLFPGPVREVAAQIVPPGAQVVTCDWRFTGEMMLALPGRRFIVALDPVFFAVNDPQRYRVWFETVRNPEPGSAALLRDTFDAQYVMCTSAPQWGPFLTSLRDDPDAAVRGVVGYWRIFELRPP